MKRKTTLKIELYDETDDTNLEYLKEVSKNELLDLLYSYICKTKPHLDIEILNVESSFNIER